MLRPLFLPLSFASAVGPVGLNANQGSGSALVRTVSSPLTSSGLIAWWDVSQLPSQTDSTGIAALPDLSGNGHTVSQGSGALQPLYRTGISFTGLPMAKFNGFSQFLTTSWTAGLPLTIFIVAKGWDSDYKIALGIDSQLIIDSNITYVSDPGTGNGNSYSDVAATQVFTAVLPFATRPTFANYRDGVLLVSNTLTTDYVPHTPTTLNLGRTSNWVGGTDYGNMYIGEIKIYNRILSNPERLAIETALMQKWEGVTPVGGGS